MAPQLSQAGASTWKLANWSLRPITPFPPLVAGSHLGAMPARSSSLETLSLAPCEAPFEGDLAVEVFVPFALGNPGPAFCPPAFMAAGLESPGGSSPESSLSEPGSAGAGNPALASR